VWAAECGTQNNFLQRARFFIPALCRCLPLSGLVRVWRKDDEAFPDQFEPIGLVGPVDRLPHDLLLPEVALVSALVGGEDGRAMLAKYELASQPNVTILADPIPATSAARTETKAGGSRGAETRAETTAAKDRSGGVRGTDEQPERQAR